MWVAMPNLSINTSYPIHTMPGINAVTIAIVAGLFAVSVALIFMINEIRRGDK